MNAFEHEQRRSMTKTRIARIYALREGRCGIRQEDGTWGDGCGLQVGFKPYEIDHIIPLSHGGSDLDDKNFQILCRCCHATKTGKDITKAAHIKRAFAKHVVPTKYKRSKAWR